MKVGEFFVDLGIKTDKGSATLRDFASGMAGLKLATVSTVGSLATAGEFFLGTIKNASSAAVSFQKFTNQTSISAQELQKWQIVAKQANVSADVVAGGVLNLGSTLARLRLTGEGVMPFSILGVSPMGGTMDVIKSLRKRMPFIEPNQFRNQLSAMGLSPEWINIMKLSDKEFANFERTAHGMSLQVETDVLRMTLAWNQLWLKIKDVSYMTGHALSGPLGRVLGEINSNWDTKTLGSAALSGANIIFNPAPAVNSLLHDYTPLGFIYDMFKGSAGKSAATTNNVSMNVYGDTHDKAFAQEVSDRVISQTEAQMPISETTGR